MAKKEEWYRQCTFEMKTERGLLRDVAWIPENLAKVGKQIYLTEAPDAIYTVVSAGTDRRDGSWLKLKENAQRNYRQTTDI